MLTYVNQKQFNIEFDKWLQGLLQENIQEKTIAIDGKAICSTGKLSKYKNIITIASAIIADSGLIILTHQINYRHFLLKWHNRCHGKRIKNGCKASHTRSTICT